MDRKHPIQNLTAQLKTHRAFSVKNLPKILLFYAKLVLQEPIRILETVNYSDAIQKHSLKNDPVFIIGHWRSGTSFLQYLLSRDPQFGYMNKFQVVFPDIYLQSESFLKPIVERIPETLNLMHDARNMSVNLELDSPSEIEIALTTMMSPASLHWGHIFPKNAEDLFNKFLFLDTANRSEIHRFEEDYRYLIQKISLKNNGRQVLLKSPGNTARVSKLFEMYPGARFIYIHRNPYDVFYSSKKMWNTLLDNLALQKFSESRMEQEIIRIYKKMVQRYLDQRTKIPDGQLAEIRFDDYIADPVAGLRQVYENLNLKGFREAEPRFRHFLENKTRASVSSYEYEERIIQMINENWEFAFREWGYPIMDIMDYA